MGIKISIAHDERYCNSTQSENGAHCEYSFKDEKRCSNWLLSTVNKCTPEKPQQDQSRELWAGGSVNGDGLTWNVTDGKECRPSWDPKGCWVKPWYWLVSLLTQLVLCARRYCWVYNSFYWPSSQRTLMEVSKAMDGTVLLRTISWDDRKRVQASLSSNNLVWGQGDWAESLSSELWHVILGRDEAEQGSAV